MVLKKRKIKYTDAESLLKNLIENKLQQLALKKNLREQKAKLKKLKKEVKQSPDVEAKIIYTLFFP